MISKIEDAIVAALRASQMGEYCKMIATYQGDFDMAEEDLILRFPAVLVVYDRSDFKTIAMGEYLEVAQFLILVGARNLRGEYERRRGVGEAEVGSYQMVRDVLFAIVGKTLEIEISEIKPLRVLSLDQSKDLSIYSIEIETSFDYVPYDEEDDAEDLTSIELRHHLPPEEEEPRASDIIEFEEED